MCSSVCVGVVCFGCLGVADRSTCVSAPETAFRRRRRRAGLFKEAAGAVGKRVGERAEASGGGRGAGGTGPVPARGNEKNRENGGT